MRSTRINKAMPGRRTPIAHSARCLLLKSSQVQKNYAALTNSGGCQYDTEAVDENIRHHFPGAGCGWPRGLSSDNCRRWLREGYRMHGDATSANRRCPVVRTRPSGAKELPLPGWQKLCLEHQPCLFFRVRPRSIVSPAGIRGETVWLRLCCAVYFVVSVRWVFHCST